MGNETEIKLIAEAMKADHERTREEFTEVKAVVKELSASVRDFVAHVKVAEEHRKTDAEFKKEVREFIKDATPLLGYVKDSKNLQQKIKITVYALVVFAILGAAGFQFK